MGSRAEGGGRSKGEGDVDAKGGRMVVKEKSLWTSDQKLHSYTASSRISISVYSAENKKKAGQWEWQTVHKEGRD